jgi:hypothetical protein
MDDYWIRARNGPATCGASGVGPTTLRLPCSSKDDAANAPLPANARWRVSPRANHPRNL